MTFVNKIKIKMKNGEEFLFEIGKPTKFGNFWEGKNATVKEISYRSIVDPSSDHIHIRAWPEDLVGAAGAINIMKNDIEFLTYLYVLATDLSE